MKRKREDLLETKRLGTRPSKKTRIACERLHSPVDKVGESRGPFWFIEKACRTIFLFVLHAHEHRRQLLLRVAFENQRHFFAVVHGKRRVLSRRHVLWSQREGSRSAKQTFRRQSTAALVLSFLLCCSTSLSFTNAIDSSLYIPVEQDDPIYNNLIQSSPIVIESHKPIFFPVPKVADTIWLMLLRRMMGMENWNSLDGDSFDGIVRLSDFSVEQATEMMNSPEYTRATFLRDPEDRFLSTFLVDKIMNDDASIVEIQ